MTQSAHGGLRVGRILAVAFLSGVVLFWVVSLYLTDGGSAPLAEGLTLAPETAFWIWAGVGVPSFSGALYFRRRALEAADPSDRTGAEPSDGGPGALQTNLIVAWALLEGPALLAGVFFLMIGGRRLLWAAVALYLVGMALTFPRAAWYDGSVSSAPGR